LFEIDGSKKSGSGTILRLSIAISAITGKPLHIFNIRDNRPRPGLKPQHLESVLIAGKLCNAKMKGAELNSKELWFTPKKNIGGNFSSAIGTAGSITALIMTILPICAFSTNSATINITKGGTDVSHSPTINYMKFVLLPTLRKLGVQASIQLLSYGYYPKGMGAVIFKAKPSQSLHSINLIKFGKIKYVKGLSVATFLKKRNVARRQALTATSYLKQFKIQSDISILNDNSNPFQKGSSITLWAKTTTGAIIGADAIGDRKKCSEEIGREAAKRLISVINSRATVDENLSDMLIPFIALAKGTSSFLTRILSNHLLTNIWLIEKLLKTHFIIKKINNLYKITKSD
jgi:RNA 3'-terminal phosphate cyclase (ATP)